MTSTTKQTTEADPRVLEMAARIFERLMLTSYGTSKQPDFNAKRTLAIATAFYEVVDGDLDWKRSAAERFAELQ